MRRLRYLFGVLLLLMATATRAQYNPENPDEPGAQPWQLTLRALPGDAGYFNLNGLSHHAAGEQFTVTAYDHSYFRFVQWEDEQGRVLATTHELSYTMPARHATLTARYAYSPDNPEEPSQASIRRHLYLRTSPENAGWFNLGLDNDIVAGETLHLTAYGNTNYVFRCWMQDGTVIATAANFDYVMPDRDVTLTAHFDYDYQPQNPDEPAGPQGERYALYGLRQNTTAGLTISYPLYLDNVGGELTGLTFDVSLPLGFTADAASALLTERAVGHSLEAEQQGTGQWRFTISGADAIRGVAGSVLLLPVHVPDTASVGHVFDLALTQAVARMVDGTERTIGTRPGSLRIVRGEDDRPDAPDYVVSQVQTAAAAIMPGNSLQVTWQVGNEGTLTAIGGWTERIYLTDANGRKVCIGTSYYDDASLAPGATVSRSATLTVPQLPGIEGQCDVSVTVVPAIAAGEAADFLSNNSGQTSGQPLTVGKQLVLTVPTTALLEGTATPVRCQLARSGSWAEAATFELTKLSGDDRLTVPQTVTIAREQASAFFYLTIADNNLCDTDSLFAIQVSGHGYDAVTAPLTISDDELPPLRLTASVAELTEGEELVLTVSLDRPLSADLPVSLLTDRPTRFSLPAVVVLPAGATSAVATAKAIDNQEPNNVESAEFVASAEGFARSSVIVLLNDNDVPDIDLTLTPDEVSESAGLYAVHATLRRSGVTGNRVTLRLTDDSQGRLLYPAQVVLEKGQTEHTFTIGVVDNAIVDGELTATISAEVFISSCNCGVVGTKQGTVKRQLTIIDNDGPTLELTTGQSVIREGDVSGTTATLTRNTATSHELAVTLHTESEGVLMPARVVIPAGSRTATFTIAAQANVQQEGNRLVTIRAQADGFNSGTAWLYVTDMTLPDMAVRSIDIATADIVAGDEYGLDIVLTNVGVVEVPARSTYTVSVAGQELTMTVADPIAPMDWHKASLTMKAPAKAGTYDIVVEANRGRAFDEVQTLNNTRTATLSVAPAYTYTLTTDRQNYNSRQTVNISGQVTAVHGSAAGLTLQLYVVGYGARFRGETVTTDADGRFTAQYTHSEGIGGEFGVGVCPLGEESTETYATIRFLGMARPEASFIKSYLYTGRPSVVRVPVKNLTDVPLHNITAVVMDDGSHYEVTARPISVLGGYAEDVVELTLLSATPSTTDTWEPLWLKLKSDEGAELSTVVYCYTNTPEALLAVDTPVIRANISKNGTTRVPVTLTNKGLGETGTVRIDIPRGQTFVSTAMAKELPSLAYGDSTRVWLQFNPEGLDVNVIQTGTIAINPENGDGLTVSYSLKVVGEAQGNLLVTAEDEFTLYGDADGNHPHLSGATVALRDYNTGTVLRSGTTDSNGQLLISDIPEGYYTLYVTAPKHDSYMQHVLVSPGETTEHTATLSYKAISISWNVEETTTEDRYEVVSDIVYETQVPVPVVELFAPDTLNLYSVEEGQELLYHIHLFNHGLITAQNVCVELPVKEGFRFTPLDEYVGFSLEAQQGRTIAVLVTRDDQAAARGRAESKGKCHSETWANWEWECKADRTAWIGKVGYFLMRACDPGEPTPKDPDPEVTRPEQPEPPKDPDTPELDPPLRYVSHPVSQVDLQAIHDIVSFVSCGMTCALPHSLAEIWVPDTKGIRECVLDEVKGRLSRQKAPRRQAEETSELRESYLDRLAVYLKLNENICGYYGELMNAPLLMNDGPTFNMLMPSMDAIVELMSTLHAGGQLYTTPADRLYATALGMMPQQSAEWYDFSLPTFIDRQMNTFRQRDGQAVGDNHCDVQKLDAFMAGIEKCDQDIRDMGYVDRSDLIANMNEDADAINAGSRSVCATVKLRFTQEVAFTRQAFRGTLVVENSTETVLTDLVPTIIATADDGTLATNREMNISLERVEGFTETSDGVYALGSKQTGTFTFLFIPTKYAAEQHDVPYTFGGSLAFNDGDGVKRHELYPVTLLVKPSPVLDMTYFMQRDIYGDDPLTETVEPVVPAEFALIINNKGYGEAQNVRMTTQQPQIVENEKGLKVDFSFVGSQVNGQPATLSFGEAIANDFGTIGARSQAYAQWWLTSSLLGHFISYDVTATHLTSYGNDDLSLLGEVSIHELIHGFTPEQGGRAFLVNDVPDANDTPDEVYFTDATQMSVARAANVQVERLSAADYRLTLTPSTAGWNYGSLADPTGGSLVLQSITRMSDGASLPVDNAWQTPVTLRDGRDPVHESRLHVVASAMRGTETWLLTFTERPQTDAIGDVVADPAAAGRIRITPLPLADQMYVSGPFSELRHVDVYDMRGIRCLAAANVPMGQGLYVGTLPKGIYHVRVVTDRGIFTQKVIKQ